MRISTQVFVRVEGEPKVMEYTDPAGVTRPMEVEIDLDQCPICGAVLPPGDFNGRHKNWHQEGASRG